MRRRPKSSLKRLAKGKSTSIQTLAKSVRSLQREFKKDQQFLNYAYTYNSTNLSGDYTAFLLSNFSSWSRIFGSSADDDHYNTVIWKSTGIDIRFTNGNESGNVNFTVMLLKFTDLAKKLIDATGAVTLNAGDAYYTQSGLTMVNKRYFKVLATKRFSLGNAGQASSTSTAQTQFGTDRRYYMKISPNKKIINPAGDFTSLTQSLDPSGNYMICVFNNNSILDLEYPDMTMNAVHTVMTP